MQLAQIQCLSVAETATALRVARVTIWRLARAGALPHTRVGAMLRFRLSDIEAYLEARSSREWRPGERMNRGPAEVEALARGPQARASQAPCSA